MSDLTQMSDEDLLKLHQSYQTTPPAPSSGLEHLSDEQLLSLHKQNEASKESMGSKVAKTAEGGLLGVADVVNAGFNPVNVAHMVESVGRARANVPTDPNLSFFEKIKQSYQKGSEQAVIPEISVDQITAGARTGIDIAHKAMLGEPVTKDIIKNTYQREQQANADFNKEVGPSMARSIGGGVASAAMLGVLAKDIASSAGLFDLADAKSLTAGYKSTQPYGKLAKNIVEEGREASIGKTMVKEDIVGPIASPQKMLERTQEKLDQYGEEIGHFAKIADEARSRDSSIRGVQWDEFQNDMKRKVINPLLSSSTTENLGKDIQGWVERMPLTRQKQLLTEEVNPKEFSFQEAQTEKSNIGNLKADFRNNNNSLAENAYNYGYRILNNHIENGIEAALKKGGSSETLDQFKKAKEQYRNLLDIETFLTNAAARNSRNLSFGLRDTGSGVLGAVMGNTPLEKVGGAIISGGLSKFARSKGEQTAASLWDTIQKIGNAAFLKTTPFTKMGAASALVDEGISK